MLWRLMVGFKYVVGGAWLIVLWWLAARYWYGMPWSFLEYVELAATVVGALAILGLLGWLFFPPDEEGEERSSADEATADVAATQAPSRFRVLVNRARRGIGYLLVIAFVVFAGHGVLRSVLTGQRRHERTIELVEEAANGVILHLSDGRACLVAHDGPTYNQRNLLLLYEGKRVCVTAGRGDSLHIFPVMQEDMPLVTAEQYEVLVGNGFTDSDIAYSYQVPSGRSNPNPERPTYGGRVSYGAPSVEARELEQGK